MMSVHEIRGSKNKPSGTACLTWMCQTTKTIASIKVEEQHDCVQKEEWGIRFQLFCHLNSQAFPLWQDLSHSIFETIEDTSRPPNR